MTEQPLPLKAPSSTADHMLKLLREHYLPPYRQPEGIFAPEIGAPDGHRRADLLWQHVSGRRRELVGHEIKVSRADLRHELEQPAKCWSWKKYCDRWWLVVPTAALLDGFDIPDDWGVMLPPSGRRTRSMTVLKAAPKLNPITQDPALRTLAVWLFWRHRDADLQRRTAQSTYRQLHERIEDLVRENEALKTERVKVLSWGSPAAVPVSSTEEN